MMNFIFPIVLIAVINDTLPTMDSPLENVLLESKWCSAYPIETLCVLYTEKITPGSAFSEKTFESIRVVNEVNLPEDRKNTADLLPDSLTEYEIEQLFKTTKLRRLYLDFREGRKWIRIDTVTLPDEMLETDRLDENLFERASIIVHGPRGTARYDSRLDKGNIYKDFLPEYAEFWKWGYLPDKPRPRSINQNYDDSVYESYIESAKRIAKLSTMKESDEFVEIVYTAWINMYTMRLKKDHMYLSSYYEFRKKGNLDHTVEISNRISVDNGNYWFPEEVTRTDYGKDDYTGEIDREVNIKVLDVKVWVDLPSNVFNFPFKNQSIINDLRNIHEHKSPREIVWEQDEDFVKSNNLPVFAVLPILEPTHEKNITVPFSTSAENIITPTSVNEITKKNDSENETPDVQGTRSEQSMGDINVIITVLVIIFLLIASAFYMTKKVGR
jgi:hypothetical protein